jgi:hypothetical protein
VSLLYHELIGDGLYQPRITDTLSRGLAGWQWLFIIEGAASFALGLVAISLLPDFPHSNTGAGMWVFTEEERQLAMERIQRDRVSDIESDHSIMYGLKLAAKDYRVWVFVRHRSSKEPTVANKLTPCASLSCSPPTTPPTASTTSTQASYAASTWAPILSLSSATHRPTSSALSSLSLWRTTAIDSASVAGTSSFR